MEEMKWETSYETGICEIDHQHKYFFEVINRFARNLEFFKREGALESFVNEVKKYADFHFCSEENIMDFYEYPERELHKKEHFKLLTQLNYEVLSAQYSGIDPCELFKFMRNWFLNHTILEDHKIYTFLHELPWAEQKHIVRFSK